MGIAFAVAPCETEHQLSHWQQLGMIQFILANDSDYIALGGRFIVFDTKRSCFAFGCTVWNDWTILSDAAILKQIMEGNMMIDMDDDDDMHDVVSVEKQPSEVPVGSKK